MKKRVFITGASGGIGKAIAETFDNNNYEVIKPTHSELDLSCAESVDSYIYNHKNDEYDVLIFCAGINRKSDIENIKYCDMLDTYQVNVFSAIQLISHFVKSMKSKRNGKIVFVSSLYASVSKEQRCNYSGSKTALTGVVRTLALELAEYNICVNAVAPGYVMTDMTRQNLSEDEIEEIKCSIPTHRLQDAQEIADLILFLSDKKNKSITGQLISVDGGFLCR